MNYEGQNDAEGKYGGGENQRDFGGKKFSPPRPSGREGLMFPPEQFLKLRKE